MFTCEGLGSVPCRASLEPTGRVVTDTLSPHRQIYCARVWIRQIFSVLRHRCVSITLRHLKHRRFFTELALRSSHPFSRRRYYGARVWICQIFSLLHQHCVSITHSHYVVLSIDGSSQSLPILPSFSSSQELLCKSVDSPNLIATMSSLRFHHIMPSQASTVLQRVGFTTRSVNLLSPTEIDGLLAFKTHLVSSSTLFSTSLCSKLQVKLLP